MTPSKPRHSRDQVLKDHAQQMLSRSSISVQKFACRLNAILFAQIDEQLLAARKVPNLEQINEGPVEVFMTQSGNWLKRVQRWLSADVDFPSWLEESWVQALDPEYGERCIVELAARYGLVAAREAGSDGCPVSAFGQLVTRLGDAVTKCGQVLADGQIDAKDRPYLPAAIETLRFVESRSFEIRRGMENELSAHVELERHAFV
ncbi:hypothetical protein ACPA5B_11750 [Pseudomonas solani]|uniref:hypothetical protein n=1 Tax=Pseudomonas solani TaxID=2731552 RepID=UPI003C2D81F8